MGRPTHHCSFNPTQLLLMAGLGSRLRSFFKERKREKPSKGEGRRELLHETFPPLPRPMHTSPRIVSATPGPQPPPELEKPPEPPVAVGGPDEEEQKEKEDLVREVIQSVTVMIVALEENGLNASMVRRHLSLAESLLHQGDAERALRYATKAMELAERLEAEQEHCPRCGTETRPKWILCPKCGAPLR
ncbi:MAG: zinc ribbon domain-containing protein [Thermoplasmata archaeon]